MTALSVRPVTRVSRPGGTSRFEVRVAGGEIATVRVVPCADAAGYEVQLPGGPDGATPSDGLVSFGVRAPSTAPMA